MRISDWSSDVCSSDLALMIYHEVLESATSPSIERIPRHLKETLSDLGPRCLTTKNLFKQTIIQKNLLFEKIEIGRLERIASIFQEIHTDLKSALGSRSYIQRNWEDVRYLERKKRSEENTTELQSLM